MSERLFNHRVLLSIFVKILVFLAPVAAWTRVESNEHEVRSGETLGGIALDHGFRKLWCHGCAVDTIAELNSLSNPNFLRVGQVLILRREDSTLAQPKLVKVVTPPEPLVAPAVTVEVAPDVAPVVAPVTTEDSNFVSESPARETATENELKSEIILGVPLHFVGIEGTDRSDQTRGTLLTNLSPGLLLGWRLNFTPEWQTEIVTRIERDEIQPDINLTNIENREQQIGELELHVRYGSTVRLGLDLKTRERLVYRAATGPGIMVQTLPMNSAGLSLDGVVLRISSASLQARIGAQTILANSQVETGLAFDGRLILRQDFERWALEAEVGYESSAYKTTLVEITGSDLWLAWGIVWKL